MLDRSREWNEADLRRLIAEQVQESIGLDYKASAALGQQDRLKREIAKDLSAFANSAGGVIVYGMTENGHVPTEVEPIDLQALSKEWLENVAISNIQPRIDGLHVNPVQLTGVNAGRVAYVVTIPQSYTAHQAADHRYYKRFNFQSVPMEHYEVQDTMNRGKTPIIDVRIEPRLERDDRNTDTHIYALHVWLDNRGAVAAKNIKVVLGFPEQVRHGSNGLTQRAVQVLSDQHGRQYRQVSCSTEVDHIMLFPADSIHFGMWGCYLHIIIDRGLYDFVTSAEPDISWKVFADDMAPRQGAYKVRPLISY